MVRTKQVRKKSSFARRKTQCTIDNKTSSKCSSDDAVFDLVSKEFESHSDFKNYFNTLYEAKIEVLKQSYEHVCSHIKTAVQEHLKLFPESLTSSKSFALDGKFQDQNESPNTPSPPPVQKPRSRKSLEIFDFKRPKTPRVSSRSSTRKRSASASVVSSSADKFKTPVMSIRMLGMGHTITPKIYSNTPMSVMRRPQVGEMAVSLTGSPLLVGSVTCEEVPTVNVPLQDGRVFSIMPQEGAPPPDLPDFDEQTKEYLRTLQAHLAYLAPRTP